MELILVRHGETQLNYQKKYCGWSDSCLTEEGLLQAKRAADKLREETIQHIYCSDLKRTVQTAERINAYHHVGLTQSKELRELNFGKWEELTYRDIKEQYPKEAADWEADWLNYAVPEGESLVIMYRRIIEAIEKIVKEHQNKRILIVSHAGCIRATLAHYIGSGIEDYWKYKVDHCGITRIEIVDNYAVLTALNQ
ncbi:alpha-ribazole phosphatase [Geosporobacter subterraneus DSM 17957]|uniref:Alpha-ribazole phosphatase n=1 Tax=Geosporobacter subterraneus DSM 17957 TaxID=1121919 RepID=A0A1M6G5L0_9FIRM|nr:alpha-ribazole phosphatase [Geosporobacter subterraneus]SHJ05229.1 alpha-ribazole phosphatase [Geosporobacter subterraneus DSM 17957]